MVIRSENIKKLSKVHKKLCEQPKNLRKMSENIDKTMNYSYYKSCKGILDGKNLRLPCNNPISIMTGLIEFNTEMLENVYAYKY